MDRCDIAVRPAMWIDLNDDYDSESTRNQVQADEDTKHELLTPKATQEPLTPSNPEKQESWLANSISKEQQEVVPEGPSELVEDDGVAQLLVSIYFWVDGTFKDNSLDEYVTRTGKVGDYCSFSEEEINEIIDRLVSENEDRIKTKLGIGDDCKRTTKKTSTNENNRALYVAERPSVINDGRLIVYYSIYYEIPEIIMPPQPFFNYD